MKKRLIAIILFALLSCLIMAGCDSGKNTEVKAWDENVTLTWWLMGGDDDYYQHYWSEMKSFQKLQEMANINIDFQVAINYEAYLPMMSARTYPHVITTKNSERYAGGMAAMYNDGVSIALNKYIEEGQMPNFKEILDGNPDIARDLKLDDGTYSYLTRIYDVSDPNQRALTSTYGLIIRQDWLDNVGMEVPTNMEEWYQVLKAFKLQDPNGNGVQDEEPYIACSSGWKYFFPAYGIDDDPSIMVNEEGEEYVVYGYTTEHYKEYLEEFNKWHTEGLLYYMFDGVSLENQRERVINNFAGAWKGTVWHLEEDNSDSMLNVLKTKAPEVEMVAAPWPKTPDGKLWCFSDISSVHRDTTVITDNAVKDGVDEAAVYLLDYMLSEEGTTLLTWGIEGESYEEVGGKKQLMDGMNDMVDFHGKTMLKINLFADNITIAFPSRGDIVAEYVLSQKTKSYADTCKTWAEGDTSYKMQATCQFTVEQQRKSDETEDQMLNYMTKMRHRFITGRIPLTQFDAYVEQCNLLGAETYTEIWQEAYDNYKSR